MSFADRELKVLQLLASSNASTQRKVADESGFSLGLVNALLRRLAKTGHIKVRNLSAKRVQYLLTPKGLSTTTRHGFAYVSRTLKTFNATLERIHQIIGTEVLSGRTHFILVGSGDVADIVEVSLKLHAAQSVTYLRVSVPPASLPDAVSAVLDCREPAGKTFGISILTELLREKV